MLTVFILVAGLRYRLGIDSTRYQYEYFFLPKLGELFSYNTDLTNYGIGYLFLNSIARSCSDSFVIMQFLHAIFINTIIFYFFYKNTYHIFVALILYFIITYFNYNFEILRESCAIVLFLFSWRYFKDNKWIYYYLYCIVAILFHPSAIFTLILPIFYLPVFRSFFKIGWKFIIIASIVLIISAFVSIRFFEIIQLLNIATVDNYANAYYNSELSGERSFNIIGIIVFSIKFIIYPLLCSILLKYSNKFDLLNMKSIERHKLEYLICWYMYIAIISMFIQLFYRFNNYLLPFIIIILADIVFHNFKCKKYKIKLSFGLWCMFLLPLFSVYIIGYFSNDMDSGIRVIKRYYPYTSVLNPSKDDKREELFRFLGGD